MKKPITLLLSFFLIIAVASAQDRFKDVEDKLKNLAAGPVPGLNEKADVYLSKTSIQTFLSGLGRSYKINLSVDPSLDIPVSLSFSQEPVYNILLYVAQKYDLDYQFTGAIISISQHRTPPPPIIEKEPGVKYDGGKNVLSLDLKGDSLSKIIKRITQVSGKNLFISSELSGKLVSVYLQEMPFENALNKLANTNDLELTDNNDGTYLFSLKGKTDQAVTSTNKNQGKNTAKNPSTNGLNYTITTDINNHKLLSIDAKNQSLNDLMQILSDELGINYVLLDEIKANVTVHLTNVSFEDFLNYSLAGTNYTFKSVNNVFILGERGKEGLRATEVLQLQYRSIDEMLETIPAELKKGVEIKEFKELNSIVLSGSSPNIEEIKIMIDKLDKPVPVVMIELIIVDITRQFNVSTGINAGVADKPVSTGGTVLPGIDLTLGGSTINKFLDLVGLSNLGGVGANFYVNLKLLENNGYVDIQSTPRLSTLNGHEATINIGKKDYYVEQTQNVVGTQNPQTIVTNTYKPVNADFSITINPVVSGDEQITLEVSVNQSDFTARTTPGAPPGQNERKFKSIIRVKNNDMIVLGGLEKNLKGDNGKGIPGLARVPVLKWLFSSRERTKQKDKLVIFIKPSIIY